MVIKNNLRKVFFRSITGFFIIVILANTSNTFAQNNADSTKKILYAAVNIKKDAVYIIKQANVIFPDILKGTEELAGNYVANFSNTKRNYLLDMYAKGKTIMPKVNDILKQYDLPEELSVLMMLESAFNGNAVSKSGAVGYWQIMDVVAKQYGLTYVRKMTAADNAKFLHKHSKRTALLFKKRLNLKDDRKNFNKSTATAARYFLDSKKMFDKNWLLIVASYNCGMGNVSSAIKKSGITTPDFWEIKKYLPKETQAYVMNFIALNVIYKNYDNFLLNNLNFEPVKVLITAGSAATNVDEQLINDGTIY